MLVLLTDNCQPIRPAGSDPAGTLMQAQLTNVVGYRTPTVRVTFAGEVDTILD